MGDFHFLRPWWFVAFVPLAIVVWILLKENRNKGLWYKYCDRALAAHILLIRGSQKRNLAVTLFALTAALIIIACAGPAWKQIPQPLYVKKSPLVIALDVSQSMLVTDIRPNRLTRARLKLEDLLDARKDGQTALIVYTSHPFVVTPLTLDTQTIKLHVSNLNSNVVPVQGSRPGLALKKAAELLKNAKAKKGRVLLITDNLVGVEVFSEARKLYADGFTTSVLIASSKEGGPIPYNHGDFVKRDSKLIIDRVDEDKIKRFINISGGRYHSITADDSDLRYLLATDFDLKMNDYELLKMKTTRWYEEGPWLFLLILPLAALAFRKGWLAVFIILILPIPNTARADLWDDLWLNKDQQALQLFYDGQHKQAAEQFKAKQWQGAAYYRMGRYKQALEIFALDSSAKGFYNQGNAYAKLGQYEKAIESYRQALKLDKNLQQARDNLNILQDYLQKQKQSAQNQSAAGQSNSQSQQSPKGPQANQNGQQNSDNLQQGSQAQSNSGDNSNQSQSQQANNLGSDQQADVADQGVDEIVKRLENELKKAQKNSANKDQKNNSLRAEQSTPSQHNDQVDKQLTPSDRYLLQQLPQDPGMLLRRKFESQYNRDKRTNDYPYLPTEPW